MSSDKSGGSSPAPNILDAMREVETGDKRMESDPEGQAIDYARTCVRNSYPIVKFARRLLEVVSKGKFLHKIGSLDSGFAPDADFVNHLDALERDYPGVLEDKQDA